MWSRPKEQLIEAVLMALIVALAWGVGLNAHAAGPALSTLKRTQELSEDKLKSLKSVTEYEVKSGDSLGAIALIHGVKVEEIMSANDLTDPDKVYAGQTLKLPVDPKNGVLTKRGVKLNVPKGFNLVRIAKAYEIPVKRIIDYNKLDNPDRLQEGQEIIVPGAKSVRKLILPPPCYKDPVILYRVRTDETRKVALCYCNGRPSPDGVTALSELAGPVRKKMAFPLHPRLAVLLQKIAEHYPGKRIEIISGQRERKQAGHESYHNKGQAIDFRVEGIANRHLVQFVRQFDRIGLGYYPNSVFIHLDTRDKKAYWVDYSRPGERAIYARGGLSAKEVQKIRDRRKKPVKEQIAERTSAKIERMMKTIGKTTSKPNQIASSS